MFEPDSNIVAVTLRSVTDGRRRRVDSYTITAWVRPRILKLHPVRRAASRADWTAGRSKPISVAMIAITTKSSTSVKPRRFELYVMQDMETSARKGLEME